MTPSFAQPTPEGRKVLDFARDICLDLLPDTVVVHPEWLIPSDVEVPQSADMEDLFARLYPRHPRLHQDTPRTERFSVPRASLAPLSLLHPLMFSLFLAPATAWHMMHAKADAMGMTQQVVPFIDWLRAATIDPLQGIASLASVGLFDATLAQKHGIRKSATGAGGQHRRPKPGVYRLRPNRQTPRVPRREK